MDSLLSNSKKIILIAALCVVRYFVCSERLPFESRRQTATPLNISRFLFTNVIKHSLSSVNSIWSSAQSHLPKNIYNFTLRYINNSLPTRTNMTRWGLSQSPDCSFCLNPESLLHIVAGCQHYLDRFTWRHDSFSTSLPTHFNL